MEYNEGEFVLIEDYNYKAKKFIGEIGTKLKNSYLLYVYIFPEDTIDGRQPYMSSNEVLFTPNQISYCFSGDKKKEQKVKVLSLENYVDKKYINDEENFECPLYFFRQTYLLEGNKYIPDILPNICYCHQIFNPDYPFKQCICGSYFHTDCLLQTNTNKCWTDNCDFNCDTLLSEEEQFQKRKITSGEIKAGNINFSELERDFNNEKEKILQQVQNEKSDNDSDSDSDSNDNNNNNNKDKDNKIAIIKNKKSNEKLIKLEIEDFKENDKEKIFKKKESLKPKLKLCYNISIDQTEDNKNPAIELISNYKEIKEILLIKDPNILKFLYFNRIHNQNLLYHFDENIDIDDIIDKNVLYFYLSLLINENSVILNYVYSIKLIENLNKERKREEESHKLKQIILAKIIIQLIKNYEETKEDEEDGEEIKLNLIKEENTKIINNNINDFKELNLNINTIFIEKIDVIYMNIIKSLIVNKKLDDSEYLKNIIKEIGLESINLTQYMFNELTKLLDKSNNYVKDYIIEKYEDIFNKKIMIFYYYLLKYILKSKYYIYHIPFLLEIRKIIRKLIKSNLIKLYPSIQQLDNDFKSIIEYVLKSFISYDLYYDQSIKIAENKNNIISNQYENPPAQNNSAQKYNYSTNNSSIHGPFSNQDYLNGNQNYSGKNFSEQGQTETDYNDLKKKCKDDICYRILQNSTFILNVNKINNKTIMKYDKIIINDKEEQIDIDKVRNNISNNIFLNNNYQKFLSIITLIENRIEKENINNL